MLLKVYAEEHNLIERKEVHVIKIVPAGKDYTIHYRISGQKYRDDKDVSKRTVSESIYDALEVDEKTGNLTSGNVVRKSNFLVWEPDSCEA